MKDRALIRFDSVVAVCALLASAIAAGAMVFQTHVIEQQFAAAVWPYLSFETDNELNAITIKLDNDGAGPALIRSAQLWIDGEPVSGWGKAYMIARAAKGDRHGTIKFTAESVDATTTLRPGDSRTLLSLGSSNPAIVRAARSHHLTIALCYCSINGSCWTTKGAIGSESSQPPHLVSQCEPGPTIDAGRLIE